jgi:hypothetical protein
MRLDGWATVSVGLPFETRPTGVPQGAVLDDNKRGNDDA